MAKDDRPVGKVRGEYREPKKRTPRLVDIGVELKPGLLDRLREKLRKKQK